MSYFKPNIKELTYNVRSVASNIGEAGDTYSISSYYWHYVEDDTITSQHEVVKNWNSSKREVLFKGTLKECFQFIEDIVVQYSQI